MLAHDSLPPPPPFWHRLNSFFAFPFQLRPFMYGLVLAFCSLLFGVIPFLHPGLSLIVIELGIVLAASRYGFKVTALGSRGIWRSADFPRELNEDWVNLPWKLFAILLVQPEHDGPERVVTFFLVVVASDVGGYVAGILFGKHPMAPTISPKKTWEGFTGSTLACIGAGIGSVVWLLDGDWWVGAIVGVVAVLTATVGDLAESMIKRDLEIKDMGGILPGHGGVMDRIDSVLFVAPAAFIYLRLILL